MSRTERDIEADLAIWHARYEEAFENLAELYAELYQRRIEAAEMADA